MSKCPYCRHELPPLDMDTVMQMLQEMPGFMENLGKKATEAYIKSGALKI